MGFLDFAGLLRKSSKSSKELLRRVVVLEGLLVVVRGLLVVVRGRWVTVRAGAFAFGGDFLEASLKRGSSAFSLQKGVVQRHALILDDPGSEISLKSQSRVAVNGLSMGPNKTLVGKHSLKTAEKHNKYNLPLILLITLIKWVDSVLFLVYITCFSR